MKRRAYILLIVVVLCAIFYWINYLHNENLWNDGPKQAPLKVRDHSALFNNGIDSMVDAYDEMKGSFVNNDTLKAKSACLKMIALSDSLHLDELKKDTAGVLEAVQMEVGDMKSNAENLLSDKDIASMRKDFKMVSESIYPLLKAIHYDGKILYWQNCPMAFGEGNDASWLSNTIAIENPYLGNKDTTMEHCGEIKDSIVSK
jgi:uncharacterized protein DUF3347